MLVMPSDDFAMRWIAATVCCSSAPPSSALDLVCCTVALARPAPLAAFFTVAVISAMAAEASSRLAAPCSVRDENSCEDDDN